MKNLSKHLEDLGPFEVEPFKAGSRSKARALELWNRRRVRYGLRPARDWDHGQLLSVDVGKLQKNKVHTLGWFLLRRLLAAWSMCVAGRLLGVSHLTV